MYSYSIGPYMRYVLRSLLGSENYLIARDIWRNYQGNLSRLLAIKLFTFSEWGQKKESIKPLLNEKQKLTLLKQFNKHAPHQAETAKSASLPYILIKYRALFGLLGLLGLIRWYVVLVARDRNTEVEGRSDYILKGIRIG
ncbi:hypothetical protein BCR41DRAFT_387132 [Lobosporangium transversale]|uniref:Uncharacterized protein n=1 Tax=Lobosporangium transversale TaxID=64571 RepID=A0A1Y2GM87_9FUNG|nr:hypothetical protein BCR41DRAFT_387132 [Lobosporangium transversale]ORZ13921.1 hypothetical protein BCR41DRAFT_387132 [Lobosporangium transversale]|eukprot:XP_021880705.1 hypothetical protein BCR41DRAFT_387132 [Lobosporangium transversale]